MNKDYIVFQVGCIECGVPSFAVGKASAQNIAEKMAREHYRDSDETGEFEVIVVCLEDMKTVLHYDYSDFKRETEQQK